MYNVKKSVRLSSVGFIWISHFKSLLRFKQRKMEYFVSNNMCFVISYHNFHVYCVSFLWTSNSEYFLETKYIKMFLNKVIFKNKCEQNTFQHIFINFPKKIQPRFINIWSKITYCILFLFSEYYKTDFSEIKYSLNLAISNDCMF